MEACRSRVGEIAACFAVHTHGVSVYFLVFRSSAAIHQWGYHDESCTYTRTESRNRKARTQAASHRRPSLLEVSMFALSLELRDDHALRTVEVTFEGGPM